MKQTIEAIYEDGLLRPLEPLNLANHERVSVTVETPRAEDWIDQEAVAYAAREGDDSISLEEVQARLAKLKTSLSESIINERGKY